jgi:hypothetical protein
MVWVAYGVLPLAKLITQREKLFRESDNQFKNSLHRTYSVQEVFCSWLSKVVAIQGSIM